MERTIVYNCTDSSVIDKITSAIKESKDTPLNKRTWSYKKLHQGIFEVLADCGYLNSKYGYSMYVMSHIQESDNVPYIIIFKLLTDERKNIVVTFNAEIKETPEL